MRRAGRRLSKLSEAVNVCNDMNEFSYAIYICMFNDCIRVRDLAILLAVF